MRSHHERSVRRGRAGLAALLAGTALASPALAAPHRGPAPPSAPESRHVYFGELHLHTTESFDAWIWGTKVTPDQAYRFGRGQSVLVPTEQVEHEQGRVLDRPVPARRAWALDFMAVTDHAEYLGGLTELDKPGSRFAGTALGRSIATMGRKAFGLINRSPPERLGDLRAAAAASDAWAVEVKAANANYQPGRFTTFIAYEWSAMPDGKHLHRNVIFKGDRAPPPFTSLDSARPEDLWAWLGRLRTHGIEALAIPHNGNLSGGLMYDWNDSEGRPIDEAYAQARALNEPLTEIVQVKGQSETMPALSPNDEFANFEVFDHLYRGETQRQVHHGSYVREALGRGLVVQSQVNANPFKYGFVGGSDIHNGLSASDETGGGGPYGVDARTMQPGPETARTVLSVQPGAVSQVGDNIPLFYSSAGLTGVWAEANTRPAIFAALKRKETFATSGTRIRLRMFGGWRFDAASLRQAGWVHRAYAEGAPMGSDLPPPPPGAGAPVFLLQAAKDPDGANLDRIQVVKVWLDGGAYREKVFDVALSGRRKADPRTGKAGPVGNTVDLKTGGYRNTIGAAVLSATWRDPEFDRRTPAVYYARVLEIPTPRWSTLLAIHQHLPISKAVPATIQERAFGSPIWYTPLDRAAARRGAAPAG
jgi:hypothetical protein